MSQHYKEYEQCLHVVILVYPLFHRFLSFCIISRAILYSLIYQLHNETIIHYVCLNLKPPFFLKSYTDLLKLPGVEATITLYNYGNSAGHTYDRSLFISFEQNRKCCHDYLKKAKYYAADNTGRRNDDSCPARVLIRLGCHGRP